MTSTIAIIGSWLICTIAAERAAEAITTSVLFSPLRQFLARTALSDLYSGDLTSGEMIYKGRLFSVIRAICRWLSDLVSCGWCTSAWTSIFFSVFLPGGYISTNAGDNILVKAIALWGIANLYHSIFRLLHNGRVVAVDLNLRLVESDVDNSGGTYGEFGQGISQENASGIEPTEV
jgi:hypothetical protein